MSDSFFGFGTGFSALGSRKFDPEELLTADVEEEYDALNDETFGDAAFDADWEEDHEKLAHLIKHESAILSTVPDRFDLDAKRDENDPQQEIVERSISHLGLEDDLDDPAIMTFSRSEKGNRSESRFRYSPPPPAILDAEICGSPKTRSIWSTLDANPKKENVYTLFSALENETSTIKESRAGSSSFPLSPSMPSNARTLAELECDLISSNPDSWLPSARNPSHSSPIPNLMPRSASPALDSSGLHPMSASPLRNDAWWYSSSKEGQLGPGLLKLSSNSNEESCPPSLHPPGLPLSANVRTLEEVEKDMLLRPRAKTLEEVEKQLQCDSSLPPPPRIPAPAFRPGSASAPLAPLNQGTSSTLSMRPHHPGTPPISVMPRGGQVGPLPSRLGTQLSPPPPGMIPPHPILNPPRLRAPPPLPIAPGLLARMKPMPMPLHGPSPAFAPGSTKLPGASLDMRRILFPRHIHHPLLNKQLARNNVLRLPTRVHYETTKNLVNGTEDEYAGLMSQKEKEWLIKIQLLQLQSDNPYVTDFYFLTYQMRKIAKEKAQAKSGKEPQLLLPEIAKQELKTYVPRQFEGSLGKLQVSSVNYPRKILEEGVNRPMDDEETKIPTNSELYWFRKLLMDIEKLYVLLLEIDDEDKRISALSEEAQTSHKELRRQLTEKLYAGITNEGNDSLGERFPQLASVRKGRHLIMRSLSFVSQCQRIGILKCLFSNLGLVLRKDHQDHVLQYHLEYVVKVIHLASVEDLISLGQSLENVTITSRSSPSREKSQYVCAFQSTFGSTVICSLLICLEKVFASDVESKPDLLETWTKIAVHIVDVLCTTPDAVLAPSLQFSPEVETHLCRFITPSSENSKALRQKLQILSNSCQSDQ